MNDHHMSSLLIESCKLFTKNSQSIVSHKKTVSWFLFCPSAKPGHCPAVDIHHVGICTSECSSDRDCQGNTKCCSNGCGRICSAPVRQGEYRTYFFIFYFLLYCT